MDYEGEGLPEQPEPWSTGGLGDEWELAPPAGETCYRQPEMDGLLHSLYAARSVLVTSGEGMGKTYLVRQVWERLLADGVTCQYFEPATPKTLLMAIAAMAGVDSKNLEGRSKTVEVLKQELIQWFSVNRAVLIFDDAHYLEVKFRLWLKKLKDVGVPILLAATNPPRTDLFIYVPRIELKPLAEYQIRDLMEKEAIALGSGLKPNQIAKLQSRAGGNPMLAKRAVEEGFLGIQNEAGDHGRYFDITPLLLLVGIVFICYRFIGLGTGNQSLYILAGIGGAIFLGVARLSYYLPKESRRISN
ncbi:ATP-binding protein [Synechocystis sp. PCC 6803]|uniref:ATP-binding protein n=1 Tax=Synechocystis sp. PCC 6803 TaxID=1148 RepID=UPI001FAF1AED|nr:ATP-binding protein [Synechocystis sp. PCC 6803]